MFLFILKELPRNIEKQTYKYILGKLHIFIFPPWKNPAQLSNLLLRGSALFFLSVVLFSTKGVKALQTDRKRKAKSTTSQKKRGKEGKKKKKVTEETFFDATAGSENGDTGTKEGGEKRGRIIICNVFLRRNGSIEFFAENIWYFKYYLNPFIVEINSCLPNHPQKVFLSQ